MLLHWLDSDELEEGTSVVELFGDFSGEPTEMAESILSALNLSAFFKKRHSIMQSAVFGRENAQECCPFQSHRFQVIRCRL